MTVQCGWERGWSILADVTRCDQPADRQLVLGCVHEHLTLPLATCAVCAADFAAEQAAGNMLCTPCQMQGGVDVAVVLVDTVPL